MQFHVPVLLKEVVEYLRPRPGGTYIDGTIGGGGHAEEIAEILEQRGGPSPRTPVQASSSGFRTAPFGGRFIGIDVDSEAVEAARERLKRFGVRIEIICTNFAEIRDVISERGVKGVDGILLDLGVSSHQLETAERGFSFQRCGPLDMRMDGSLKISAVDLVNSASAKELERWFREYGEERYARRIADVIVRNRKAAPITTTEQLAELVLRSVPPAARRGRSPGGRIHPATRVFQALRIAVNDELGNLKRFLDTAPQLLNEAGRLVIISYHSLEDRLVKRRFRELGAGGGFKVLTKKPVTPSAAEITENPRARSAKLRVMERL